MWLGVLSTVLSLACTFLLRVLEVGSVEGSPLAQDETRILAPQLMLATRNCVFPRKDGIRGSEGGGRQHHVVSRHRLQNCQWLSKTWVLLAFCFYITS